TPRGGWRAAPARRASLRRPSDAPAWRRPGAGSAGGLRGSRRRTLPQIEQARELRQRARDQRADRTGGRADGGGDLAMGEAPLAQQQGGPLFRTQTFQGGTDSAAQLGALEQSARVRRRVRWSVLARQPSQLATAARCLERVLCQIRRHYEQPPFHLIPGLRRPGSQLQERLLHQVLGEVRIPRVPGQIAEHRVAVLREQGLELHPARTTPARPRAAAAAGRARSYRTPRVAPRPWSGAQALRIGPQNPRTPRHSPRRARCAAGGTLPATSSDTRASSRAAGRASRSPAHAHRLPSLRTGRAWWAWYPRMLVPCRRTERAIPRTA